MGRGKSLIKIAACTLINHLLVIVILSSFRARFISDIYPKIYNSSRGVISQVDISNMAFLYNLHQNNHIHRRVPIYRARKNPLDIYCHEELIAMYRFPRNLIEEIAEICDLPEPENDRGKPIPTIVKVCSALRFYATGESEYIAIVLHDTFSTNTCESTI